MNNNDPAIPVLAHTESRGGFTRLEEAALRIYAQAMARSQDSKGDRKRIANLCLDDAEAFLAEAEKRRS